MGVKLASEGTNQDEQDEDNSQPDEEPNEILESGENEYINKFNKKLIK